MKKILITTLAVFAILGASSLGAQEGNKCTDACQKYYNCVIEKNPNASESQKNLLKSGCEMNCKKPKYYSSIASCYDKSQNSCQAYWGCITKALQK
jgi:Cys-rich protein (TIGR04453 family)